MENFNTSFGLKAAQLQLPNAGSPGGVKQTWVQMKNKYKNIIQSGKFAYFRIL